ncbi:hypothetical protein JRQ81_008968 [Phrynocephalus forsythii]|uniref:Ran-binding protein 3 n=1 Tax=Phrynocephalus forsythii TaxID=171643 RepID=A0A9Q1ASS5_9SAUR|nr:hypothetical protein JRQ81_008968 [Phrynocephalus forsythii]
MADLANEEKPALAPPVFVFQKDKAQKRSADGSSPEDGEAVRKNNIFMPSSFCEASAGNSDSEPEEKNTGFRLKPPTLIHGQAPSAVPSSGTNGVGVLPDSAGAPPEPTTNATPKGLDSEEKEKPCPKNQPSETEKCEKTEQNAQQSFVFGQNLRDRVKLGDEGDEGSDAHNARLQSPETPLATNYFLQYISSSIENSTHSADASGNKFVFGQNMSERVLSPPKSSEASTDSNKENAAGDSGSESSSQEATPEKANNVSESLAESAAAYTKATARKCLLEKVEVITGEEAESNVLQVQCKLFVFDKTSQSWVERGRGLLRLNDMASTDDGTLQSRLGERRKCPSCFILRGPSRLSPGWMQIDKASEKSIRITAMDTEDQGVKVFLISASSKDTGQLYACLAPPDSGLTQPYGAGAGGQKRHPGARGRPVERGRGQRRRRPAAVGVSRKRSHRRRGQPGTQQHIAAPTLQQRTLPSLTPPPGTPQPPSAPPGRLLLWTVAGVGGCPPRSKNEKKPTTSASLFLFLSPPF